MSAPTPQGAPQGRSRREGRDRGAVLMLTAIALPVFLLMTAFAVDLGRQRVARRDAQAAADVIALDLARLMDGTAANAISYQAAKVASANRNGIDPDDVLVEYGQLTVANQFSTGCPTCAATAVRVTADGNVRYFFQPGSGDVTRRAIAARDSYATASIGSFAAALDLSQSNLVNQVPLLNALIGDALNLGALGYSGLARYDITLLDIATQMGLGTPSQLFNTDVTAYDVLLASSQLLQQRGANAADVQVLNTVLGVSNNPLRNVSIADLVSVQAGAEDSALATKANVFDLLATAAFVANGDSALAIPNVSLGGIFTGNAHITQGPQTWTGRRGAKSPLTSQIAIDGTINIDTGTICQSTANLLAALPLVGNLLQLLLGAGGCGLLNLNKLVTVQVAIGLHIDLAAAEGEFTHIACPPTGNELDVAVRSDLAVVRATASVLLKAGNTTLANIALNPTTKSGTANGMVEFTVPAPDQYDVFKQSTPPSGALGLDSVSLGASGLGPIQGAVEALVNPVLTTTLSSINTNVVVPLSKALGLRVASADVAARNISCDSVILAG